MTRFEITYSASGIPPLRAVVEAFDAHKQKTFISQCMEDYGYILQFISVLSNGH